MRPSDAEILEGTQGRLSRRRPFVTGLLLHGRHHPTPAVTAGFETHRRTFSGIWPAGGERISRRRRQSASADSVRCQQPRRAGTHRGLRREDSGTVRRGRRDHHRRTWCGHGKDRPDVRPVRCAGIGLIPRYQTAWDQVRLLNPGKAVPALHRCAELGAMHVHAGQLKHPELPRF